MSRHTFLRRWVDKLLNRRSAHDAVARCVRARKSSFKTHSRPRLEQLEDRLAPAVISDGGTTALSIALQPQENLAIVSNGNSYTFTSDHTFAAVSGTDPLSQAANFTGFGTKSLTITASGLGQYTGGINITDSGAGASVTFNGSGAGSFSNSFNLTLTNAFRGDVTFNNKSNFGAFNLSVSATRKILLNPGAMLASTEGNLTLSAIEQTPTPDGVSTGVTINGGKVTSAGGNIQITGSVLGNRGDGILISGAGVISTSGKGSVTLLGTATQSGASFGGLMLGIDDSGGTISSQHGNIQVTGIGGGRANGNDGVITGSINTNGSGTVTIQGTGGLGTSCVGVIVSGTVSTGGGDVTITGQGGQGALLSSQSLSGQNYGVEVNGKIISGGTGSVTVKGTGGASGFGDAFGVYVTPPSRGDDGSVPTITSSGGNVVVIGQGGGRDDEPANGVSGGFSSGVYLIVRGLISAGGDGSVTVQGTGGARGGGTNDGVHLVANTGVTVGITSNNGDVLIIGKGGGSPIQGTFDSPNYGIEAYSPLISAGGKGNLTIIATANYGDGAVLQGLSTAQGSIRVVTDSIYLTRVTTGSNGSVTLAPYTPGTPINIGSTLLPRTGAMVFYAQNFKYLSANTITFGDANTGPITISAPIAFPTTTNLNFTSASDIVQTAPIDTHGGNLTLSPGSTGAFKPLAAGTDVNVGSGALQFAPAQTLR